MRYNYFYELPVYKQLRKFRIRVRMIVNDNFPKEEKFGLTSQIIRSSRSITANFAEGFGRFHQKENIQFCRQARGSLDETFEHIITSYDDKFISKESLSILQEEYHTCRKELNTYIKYLSLSLKNLQSEANNQ